MLQQQVHIINTFLMILDALCIIVSGYAAYFLMFIISDEQWSMGNSSFIATVLLMMFLNNYIMGRFRLYEDRRLASVSKLFISICKAVLVDFAILSALMFMLKNTGYSRKFLLTFAFFTLCLLVTQRLFSQLYINRLYKKGFSIRKIILVGEKYRCEVVSDALENQLSWGHTVVGRIAINSKDEPESGVLGGLESLPEILRKQEIDEVVFAIDNSRSVGLFPYIDVCKKMGVSARILPSLWRPSEDIAISVEKCQNIPFIIIPVDRFNATGLFYKRVLDVAGGLVGTLIFIIMFPFILIIMKFDSPGPVLFKQLRVGQHGRLFKLYKFRSMCVDADKKKSELIQENEMQGEWMFKMRNDPRVTPFGRFLRKTSIDEFPQFLNVLKGEMSLVGTRPPTPEEVETYQLEHLKRIALKPGITGLWQTSGRNQIRDFNEIVKLDCKYIENWRFLDDILILMKTVLVVLKRKGAI